jgi:pimeloyl-ACP methyl ester carboxylesterase
MQKLLLTTLLLTSLFYQAVATGNYSFTVKQTGVGKQAIILIPGFASSADVWNETVEQLKSNHTCYVLNMPGFAGATPEADPDIANWVKQVAQYIQDNKIDHPIIIGHSMGGVMAEWLAADYPQLVSKIVVVDALPCLPALSNPTFSVKPQPDCSMLVNNFTAMSNDAFYQMQKGNIASLVSDTTRHEMVVQWSVKSDRNTLALIFCQFMNTDMRTKISDVRCPTLVLLEPGFNSIQSSITEQFKNLKGAQLHYAAKGLHFIMYDDKTWYFNEVKNFIQ